jgi:hypothetical protein
VRIEAKATAPTRYWDALLVVSSNCPVDLTLDFSQHSLAAAPCREVRANASMTDVSDLIITAARTTVLRVPWPDTQIGRAHV